MKRITSIIAFVVLVVFPLGGSKAFAASASLYLGRSAASVVQGSYITVYVYENSGSEPVNAVQANFSYNTAQLQFISISNGSAFSIVAQNSGGGGSVSIARGALPAVSGNQLVASVSFKALVNSGTASLAISGGSSVVSANNNANIMSSTAGTSFALVAPAPTPPPAPKDTTPPTISKIEITSITATSAIATWTTSEPATSEVDYGLTTGYGLSTTDGKLVTSHSVPLQSPMIIAGTNYHFIVKSADQAGNSATSTDSTFTTKGVTLLVTIINSKTSKPLSGVQVSFNGEVVTTDREGQATLQNLPSGKVVLDVATGGKSVTETVDVTGSTSGSKPQSVFFKVAAATQDGWLPVTILFLLAVLLGGALATVGRQLSGQWVKRRGDYGSAQLHPYGQHAGNATGMPTVFTPNPATQHPGTHNEFPPRQN